MGLHHNRHSHVTNSLPVSQPSCTLVRDVSHPPTYSHSTSPAPHHLLSLSYWTETEDAKDQETIQNTQAIRDLFLCLPLQALICVVLPFTNHPILKCLVLINSNIWQKIKWIKLHSIYGAGNISSLLPQPFTQSACTKAACHFSLSHVPSPVTITITQTSTDRAWYHSSGPHVCSKSKQKSNYLEASKNSHFPTRMLIEFPCNAEIYFSIMEIHSFQPGCLFLGATFFSC